MKETWRPLGLSDPLSYTCTCSNPGSGKVLLFYRYFDSPPKLPAQHLTLASDPSNLASFHASITRSLSLRGKIRVAKEGFNVTVGGTAEGIAAYIDECVRHWSFSGLEEMLGNEEGRRSFFKPTRGCACVFASGKLDAESDGGENVANVRVCNEITPMGVSGYVPRDWGIVESLEPAEFHERLCGLDLDGGGENVVLVDVRNHYESRIGYFVNPSTEEPALRPAIRRFGQWPQFVKIHLSSPLKNTRLSLDGDAISFPNGTTEEVNSSIKERTGTQYMTYCTGGIRCEKGSRYLAENIASAGDSVCTLHGGIQAYLMWMDEEIIAGRKTSKESLFKGRNYVFDARGSTALSLSSTEAGQREEGDGSRRGDMEMVATCHVCGRAEDRLSKCRSKGCHLVLVVCEKCEDGDVTCCGDCLQLDQAAAENAEEGVRENVEGEKVLGNGKVLRRPICECERERELKLWGEKRKPVTLKSGPTKREKQTEKQIDFGTEIKDESSIRIRIKTIE